MANPAEIFQHLNRFVPRITSFFKGTAGLRDVLSGTLNTVLNTEPRKQLYLTAQQNLAKWQAKPQPTSGNVQVVAADWGTTLIHETSQHGATFAVLNMANRNFCGGGLFEGGTAQEEEMNYRSTVSAFLRNPEVYFDNENDAFCYTPEIRQLIGGSVMSKEEIQTLAEYRSVTNESPKKVLFNPNQVLFRGPATYYQPYDDAPESRQRGLQIDIPSSFAILAQDQITPFHELRSAAPYNDGCRSPSEIRQCLIDGIKAQLDTLILHGQRNVILSAWGCGSYNNDAKEVAEIYAHEIDQRRQYFNNITFAILSPRFSEQANFEVFNKILGKEQIKLDAPASTQSYAMRCR